MGRDRFGNVKPFLNVWHSNIDIQIPIIEKENINNTAKIFTKMLKGVNSSLLEGKSGFVTCIL